MVLEVFFAIATDIATPVTKVNVIDGPLRWVVLVHAKGAVLLLKPAQRVKLMNALDRFASRQAASKRNRNLRPHPDL